MADSLKDRQFETMRRVLPGRTAPNRDRSEPAGPVRLHSEEFATAVVTAEGLPIGEGIVEALNTLVEAQRLTNHYLWLLCAEHGYSSLAGDASDLN